MNDVRLVVIQRGHRIGIRMWDNQREERRTFPTRTWFDIDESFCIPATYNAYDRPKKAYSRTWRVKNPNSLLKVIYHSNSMEITTSLISTRKITVPSSSAFGIRPAKMNLPNRSLPYRRRTKRKIYHWLQQAYSPPCSITTSQPVSSLQSRIIWTFGDCRGKIHKTEYKTAAMSSGLYSMSLRGAFVATTLAPYASAVSNLLHLRDYLGWNASRIALVMTSS